MYKGNLVNNKSVVFSRWTRKNYAIYASLHKVVLIAQLTIDVCKSAILKSNVLVQFLDYLQCDEDEELDFVPCSELIEGMKLEILTVTNRQVRYAEKSINEILIIQRPYIV